MAGRPLSPDGSAPAASGTWVAEAQDDPSRRGIADSNVVLLLLSAAAIAPSAIIHFTSEGVFDIGDGVHHYEIARYSWQHPELFLDHWGKPLFTLLSSPAAQLGYSGAVGFNLVCTALTAFCAGLLVRALRLSFAPAAVLLTVFMPLPLTVAISGLTEPLFALLLMLSVLLMVRRRPVAAALLVSFLPFARTEGFFLLPLFAVVLLGRRKAPLVPLLAAGTVLYSIVGGFHFGDALWVIHRNPYRGAEEIYGRGSLWHFVAHIRSILGTAGAVSFLVGLLWTLWRARTGVREQRDWLFEPMWLVFGTFLTYLALHSVLWRFGLFGSFGMLRVMAAVSPLAAVGIVIAMNGLRMATLRRGWTDAAVTALVGLVVSANAYQSLSQPLIPFGLSGEGRLAMQAAGWIQEQRLDDELMYCEHPYITFNLDRDRFDRSRTRSLWDLNGTGPWQPGALVVWDSHFGPAEVGIPLDRLRNDPRLELLHSFEPGRAVVRAGRTHDGPAVHVLRVKRE